MSPDRSPPSTAPRGRYPGSESPRGLGRRIRKVLGIRRSFDVDGVRYKEVSTEPLRFALSRRGEGFKDYDVTFRNGNRMQIRFTHSRVFADLVPPPNLPVCLRAERLLRPGMRVAVLPCGTGYAAAVVSGCVAPSGGVVALDPDEQSVEFARLRYPIQNISFECGGLEHLSGETDGAFDAIIAVIPHDKLSDEAQLAELWRLTGTEGWLLVASPVPQARGSLVTRNEPRPEAKELAGVLARVCAHSDGADSAPPSTAHVGLMGDGVDGWVVAIARRGGS